MSAGGAGCCEACVAGAALGVDAGGGAGANGMAIVYQRWAARVHTPRTGGPAQRQPRHLARPRSVARAAF